MELVHELENINYLSLIVAVIVALMAVRFFTELFDWFVKRFGFETKKVKENRKEHELLLKTAENLDALQKKRDEDVSQSIRHDNIIKEQVSSLALKVDNIGIAIEKMQEERDADKRAEYKDKLGRVYSAYSKRKYSDDEPVPYWNNMEKEAFEDLIKQYEARGGTNSFVHTEIQPAIMKFKVVEINER